MSAPRLSYGDSGARVYAVVAEAARQAKVSLTTFVRPIANNPASWIEQVRNAQQPRPGTIVRVNALLAGELVPEPPAGNFYGGSKKVQAFQPSALTGIAPTSAPADREPCWYCGVRGDIGCSCRRRG
jgi:hypothetical protein